MKKFAYVLAAAFACVAAPASAAYVVDIAQVGNDIVATGSGSFNLAGLGNPGFGTVAGNLGPRLGRLAVGSGQDSAYSGTITGPRNFGTGEYLTPDSVTGVPVGFNVQSAITSPRFIFVPFGYRSGDSLGTSTATYDDKTFADFGLTPGSSYTWTWGTGANLDSFTVNILAAVPEPATWAMMIAGFGLVGAAMRRRSKATAVGLA